jgi:hypothetical protein
MNKRNDKDLIRNWKVPLPATLCGRVELMLLSPIHQKPIYGARSRLLESLLEYWVAVESGREPPRLVTLEQLRSLE